MIKNKKKKIKSGTEKPITIKLELSEGLPPIPKKLFIQS